MDAMASSGSGSGESQGNNLWALLPSFDPAVYDIREYVEKVKFLQGICPKKPAKYAGAKVGDGVQGHSLGPGQED